ncbi:MAG: methionyl-tRNA formyltransferase [Candidatus Dormibacteria bacterium]
MRVLFAGSAEFSLPVLEALAASHHPVVAVVTAPDRPGSRGAMAPRPVRDLALDLGLPLLQPRRLTDVWERAVEAHRPQVLLVAAYGQLLPASMLGTLPFGGLGVHPSLLPRHRGASPVAAAILAGDERTGTTIFRMDDRLDAGPVLLQATLPVAPDATSLTLGAELSRLGGRLAVRALDLLDRGSCPEKPQAEALVSYSHRLQRKDGDLSWSQPAMEIDRRLRALTPWPGVTVPIEGRRVKLLQGALVEGPAGQPGEAVERMGETVVMATAEGAFRVELIQPPGGRPMTPLAFLRGRQSRGAGHSDA